MKPHAIPKAIDVKGPLVIGEPYEIQCVSTVPFKDRSVELWLPIFGEMHWDVPEVGCGPRAATGLHWHLDMRFLTKEEMSWLDFTPSTQGAIAIGPGMGFSRDYLKGGTVHCRSRWETRRCERLWQNHTKWPPASCDGDRAMFERPFKKSRINPTKPVCPHQNFDLSGVEPTMINGKPVLVCPGHMLGWCARTGDFVPSQS